MSTANRRARLATVVVLVATACSHATSPSLPPPGQVRQGGNVVLAAEGEPECMDWIGACAGSAWGVFTVETNTMPRAYDFTNQGYQPSILLTGPATLQMAPQQVVTYHLNPRAVWSDGQPITSADFAYTWDQIVNGANIYSRAGYNQIASVDDHDPRTAVVTFSSPYPDWQSLFGGTYGIFPSHLLVGKDRDSAMADGYRFSGGPWLLDHWTKGTELELVPNPRYWGQRPHLASVTFRFITDAATERQAFELGQVLAMYPQPESTVVALRGVKGSDFSAVTGLVYEAAWFNTEQAPLNDVAVRRALAYATDRAAIVSQLLAPIEASSQPINSFYSPAVGAAYSDAFAEYQPNPAMVTQLMTGAGWTRGPDGMWTKNGVPANLNIKTTTDSGRRQSMARMLQQQWNRAGFSVTVTSEAPATLFGQDLPSGNFSVGLYGESPPDSDLSECPLWCSANIPTQADAYLGQNWARIDDPSLDKPWTDAASNLDPAARLADAHTGQAALATLVPAIPIDALPDILVVNTDEIGIPGGTFPHNFAYGPFASLNTWYLR